MSCWGTFLLAASLLALLAPRSRGDEVADAFANPPAAAKPWVFWYWMHGCVSRDGIDADLDAMQQAGVGGAYLMPIKGPLQGSPWPEPVEQLSPEWWDCVRHATSEAERRGLKIAMHLCDGFATAGGPWITPAQSMQRVVWSSVDVAAGTTAPLVLPQPETNEGYYRDIAVLAFPVQVGSGETSRNTPPSVTTSLANFDAQFLAEAPGERRLRLDQPGWIQYEFEVPFTCRSVTITPDGGNYQAQRLKLEVSDDGWHFHEVAALEPPRHGWQNGDGTVTHAIPSVTARIFRFRFDKAGSEPGAEDLDSAKWSPVLKVRAIELAATARVHQFRGKSGAVWRVGRPTPTKDLADEFCVPGDAIIDLTDRLGDDGRLNWSPPAGRWTVLRLGHTATGARNATGGAGQGLECDKLNAAAVREQFDNWFGRALETVGPQLAATTLTTLHVDSWECGSQNWTADLVAEFTHRRGYSPLPFLPALAGIPIDDADASERFLHDFRQTLAELLQERFFGTLAELAHQHHCQFSAECVAPTMLSAGMQHFAAVDLPMGEFWLRSPTHDKPNDMLDAISAAHVYGKPIVQAEAFTQLRIAWDEHPALLKPLADRELARGVNRLVFHVMAHNPWLDRAPGMTLDSIGLLFQRGQTWWPAARAWTNYVQRCQALLQLGVPVADIAVFAGEEIPNRAVLPERLVSSLPGLIAPERIERERRRLANEGAPLREEPPGVRHSANMADPQEWISPLEGFAYDSMGRDALLELATVHQGRIELPGGASYRLLVIPAARPLQPAAGRMSIPVARKLLALVKAGATVVLCERPTQTLGLAELQDQQAFAAVVDQLWPIERTRPRAKSPSSTVSRLGQGCIVRGPLTREALDKLSLVPDTQITANGADATSVVAWTHRRADDAEIYFLSNQTPTALDGNAVLRCAGGTVTQFDAVAGSIIPAEWQQRDDQRTGVRLQLAPFESAFVVVASGAAAPRHQFDRQATPARRILTLDGPWRVSFASGEGATAATLRFEQLQDWSQHDDPGVRYFSGTAQYNYEFTWHPQDKARPVWLRLGRVENMARVTLNGAECGVAWTAPYQVELTPYLRDGVNELSIEVTNTWKNRLIGEARGAVPQQAWTLAKPPATDAALLPAGLLGPVEIWSE
ncbi:MAG: discoidin domain-containing protein [Planctomycetales bacterium]|nr:discoidin domain-containing protein [Planctomycetales bacterium]